MVIKKYFFCIYILFLSFTLSFAQNKYSIEGIILNEKDNSPIIGANVFLLNTTLGNVSNKFGKFSFENLDKKSYTIRVSYLGYGTKEKTVNLMRNSGPLVFKLSETVFDFDAVVVTGTRTEKRLKDTPVLTELITKKQIEEVGTNSLREVLETLLPSIIFAPDQHGANIRFQGLNNKYVLFLINGERIAGETTGNIDFLRLNTSNIEKIEVVKGASSSLYGSNAIGGVVNIITQKPNRNFELTLKSRIGTFNEQNHSGAISFKKGILGTRTNFFYRSTNGYDLTPETKNLKTQEEFKDNNISQTFLLTPTKNLNIELRGSYYLFEEFNLHSVPYHPKHIDKTVGTEFNYIVSPKIALKLVWHLDEYDQYNVMEKLNNEAWLTYRHQHRNYRLMGNIELFKNHLLTIGTELNFEKLHSERISGTTKSINEFVLFAQDEFYIIKNLKSVIGARLNNHKEYGLNFTPQVSFMYSLDKLNIRSSIGKGFKAPTLKELYMDFDHFGMFHLYGNQNLKPEKSTYINVSFEYNSKFGNLTLSFFKNNLQNMIVQTEEDKDNDYKVYKNQNISKAMTQGIEILLKLNVGYGLSITGGYNLLDTEDKDTALQLFGIHKHSGRFALTYNLKNRENYSSISLQCKAIGAKFYEYQIWDPVKKINVSIKTKKAPVAIWKLTTINKLNSLINISAGIDNIFNYTDKRNFTTISPGRTFFLSLGINLTNNLF